MKQGQWLALLQAWKTKQNEYKGVLARQLAEKAAKAASKAAAEKKAAALAAFKAKKAEKAKEEGVEEEEESSPKKAKKDEEEEDGAKEMEVDEEPEEVVVDFDAIDVFGVADVRDVGNKMPLFKDFGFEDWAMTTLRYEIYLLAHSFCKDANDPDRTGMHIDHLNFYYQKYYNKSLNYKSFGVESAKDLLDMIDDTVWVTKSIIEAQIPADLESNTIFIRLAEEARRYRGLRLELGEESARLKIVKPGEGLVIQGQGQGEKRTWAAAAEDWSADAWSTKAWQHTGAAAWNSKW